MIGYFTNKHNSPYLVYGMINGNNSLSISQDPKNSSSVTLLRSNNGVSGLEFTWSVWLFVSGIPNETKYAHVFNKGDTNWLSSGSNKGISTVNNSPGLYITKDTSNSTLSLYIQMDMDTNINEPYKNVEIKDIPLNKWFNVCIRMQNVVLDVYVNGINSGRVVLPNIPRQNYNNVNVCNNGGFNGNLSNLRYFNYALSIFDINYIAWSGPRLKSSSIGNTAYKGSNNFISDSWYFSKM